MIEKISAEEFTKFQVAFYKNTNVLRFGQAFLNRFFPDLAYPELFYEENTDKALEIIFKEFIEEK